MAGNMTVHGWRPFDDDGVSQAEGGGNGMDDFTTVNDNSGPLLTDQGDLLSFNGTLPTVIKAGVNETILIADDTQAEGWRVGIDPDSLTVETIDEKTLSSGVEINGIAVFHTDRIELGPPVNIDNGMGTLTYDDGAEESLLRLNGESGTGSAPRMSFYTDMHTNPESQLINQTVEDQKLILGGYYDGGVKSSNSGPNGTYWIDRASNIFRIRHDSGAISSTLTTPNDVFIGDGVNSTAQLGNSFRLDWSSANKVTLKLGQPISASVLDYDVFTAGKRDVNYWLESDTDNVATNDDPIVYLSRDAQDKFLKYCICDTTGNIKFIRSDSSSPGNMSFHVGNLHVPAAQGVLPTIGDGTEVLQIRGSDTSANVLTVLNVDEIDEYTTGASTTVHFLRTDENNILLRTETPVSLTSGEGNIAIGECLDSLTSGTYNICLGDESGNAISTASNNIAIGRNSYQFGLGAGNISIGNNASQNVTGAVGLTMVGTNCGSTLDSSFNTGYGDAVLAFGQAGVSNAGFGYQCLSNLDIGGQENACFGYNCALAMTSGQGNSLFGSTTGDAITTGSFNCGFGGASLGVLTTGDSNTILGTSAGSLLTTGSRNLLLGESSGSALTTENDQLRIENSTNAIITGDFSTQEVNVPGTLLTGPDSAFNGISRFKINGTSAGSGNNASIQEMYISNIDNYPGMQLMVYNHDDINLCFDAYYNAGWKSSDAGSNCQIKKTMDELRFSYDSAVAQGDTVTWNLSSSMDLTTGEWNFSQAVNYSGGISFGTSTLSDYNEASGTFIYSGNFVSNPTADIYYTQVGNTVTITFLSFSGSSNGVGTIDTTTNLPSAIRPTQLQNCYCEVLDNSVAMQGSIEVAATGAVTIYSSAAGVKTGFSAMGTKGLNISQSFSYVIT